MSLTLCCWLVACGSLDLVEPNNASQPGASTSPTATTTADANNPAPTTVGTGAPTSSATLSFVNGVGTIPMSGCVAMDYFVGVNVGGTVLNLLLDSGSTTMATASNTCTSCSPAKEYVPSASSKRIGKAVTSTYGDGSSWSGVTYSDTVAVGDAATLVTPPVTLTFADIGKSNQFFETVDACQAGSTTAFDGIFGVGPDTELIAGTNSFLTLVASTGKMARDEFALQTCDVGGTLTIGGYDANAMTAAPNFTPLVTGGPIPAYQMGVSALGLGTTDLGLAAADISPMVVDNGTNSLILSPNAFNKFVASMQANPVYKANFPSNFISGALGQCVSPSGGLTRAQLDAQLPPLTFTLPKAGGGTFQISVPATSSYLVAGYVQGDASMTVRYCPAVAESNQVYIFGNSVMRSHVVIFDRQGNQIGFAPQTGCAQTLIPYPSGT